MECLWLQGAVDVFVLKLVRDCAYKFFACVFLRVFYLKCVLIYFDMDCEVIEILTSC